MASKNGVRLNWGGLDSLLRNAPRKLANRKQLLNAIGETLVSSTTKRFMEEKDPEGKGWKKTKRAEAEGGKILQEKALLRSSIDHKPVLANNSVLLGSNLPYARIHQLGGEAGRNHSVTIDARPYLGFSKEDREEVIALVQAFMKDAFKG